MLRDEVLGLAELSFARRLVNSGPSMPCSLAGLALQSPDDPAMNGAMVPARLCGCPMREVSGARLLDHPWDFVS